MGTTEEASSELEQNRHALVITDAQEREFAEYAEARDKWLATPIAHNTTLARGGFPFTIVEAGIRIFEATELDATRGYKVGDPVEKIAYLCISQRTWWHYAIGEEDVEYPEGSMFLILFNSNPVRMRDYERITKILPDGWIHNICLQEYPNKTKGFNPAHGLVSASQWKSLV